MIPPLTPTAIPESMDGKSPSTAGLDMPLPCPFCGSYDTEVCDGSTFRWVYMGCADCGARAGEVRVQTIGIERDAAIKRATIDATLEWNTRSNIV